MKLIPRRWTWDRSPASWRQSWLDIGEADAPVVWLATVTDDPMIVSDLSSLLSADERIRLEQFRMSEDRRRFLIGRGLLRVFLGGQLGVSGNRVPISQGPHGKPGVATGSSARVHFNVAHSGDLVALAFHPAREVGVDIEEIQPDHDWKDVARRLLSPGDFRQWQGLGPAERLTTFFQAWVRHEAQIKTRGGPLVLPRNASTGAEPLTIYDLEMPAGYRGAAGLAGRGR
jgi:4'-phosphopantetheinyl transferase